MIQTHKKAQERLGEIESNKRSTWGRPKYPPPVPKNSRQRPYISVSLSVPLLSPSLPLASHSLSTSSIPVSIPFCPSPSIKQDQQSTISNNQKSNVVLMLQPECMVISWISPLHPRSRYIRWGGGGAGGQGGRNTYDYPR